MATALANALAGLEPLKRHFSGGMGPIFHHDGLAIMNAFGAALATLAAGDTEDPEPPPVEDPNVGMLAPVPVNVAPPGEPFQAPADPEAQAEAEQLQAETAAGTPEAGEPATVGPWPDQPYSPTPPTATPGLFDP
jgi:hypothetical protein